MCIDLQDRTAGWSGSRVYCETMQVKRATRRIVPATLALFSFCVAYAAPLGVALFESGMADKCCHKGKAAHCCKRTSSPAWMSAGSSCAGQCPGGFTSATVSALDVGSADAHQADLAAGYFTAIAPQFSAQSSSYLAFLYQRPPPIG